MSELSIDTQLDIYQRLEDERRLVTDPNAGHVVKRDAWERIDFLLDSLVLLEGVDDGTTQA
jgi:hypothetical protein